MTNNQATRNSPHPLIWITGTALTVFSVVGIAAFMGWMPSSASTGNNSMAEPQSSVKLETPAKSQMSAQTPTARAQQKAPVQLASSAPARSSVRCAECGVIESVREIDTKGKGSGLGAVGGAVVGGLLGNQTGAGTGKDVMTVVGAVGGAMAGNEIEKRAKSTTSHSITVRFEDGTSRVVNAASSSTWRAGDKVRVINGAIQPAA